MKSDGQARVVRVKHKTTGKVRYLVKVGDRRVGRSERYKYEAQERADAWNARFGDAAKSAREEDTAAVRAYLEKRKGQAVGVWEVAQAKLDNDEERAQKALNRLVKEGTAKKHVYKTTKIFPQPFLRPAKVVPVREVTYSFTKTPKKKSTKGRKKNPSIRSLVAKALR